MANAVADEELLAGLNQARTKPRNYAIILKGQTVLAMIVRKKKLKDVQKIRAQYKGTDDISGVCIRNGAELVLQVLESEPSLGLPKVRNFIEEQTELKLKPQWSVVTEFAAVPDADEIEPEDQPAASASAADAPPTTPAPPASAPPSSAQPAASPTVAADDGSLVTMQKCRLVWDAARKKLHADLQSIAKAVQAECANPDEYDPAEVAAGVGQINQFIEKLDLRLINKLDQALNAADGAERKKLQREAAGIVQEYKDFVQSEPLMKVIDDNGLVAVAIRPTMTSVLEQLAKRL